MLQLHSHSSNVQSFYYSQCHVDAKEFEEYLLYGSKQPSAVDFVTIHQREMNSVPKTVKNLCVQRFQLSSECSSLRTLVLADHSGLQESRFELNGYSELQRVRIGRYCYISETCSFAITNCPKLKSIQIGPESFSHCKSFELKGFPALQTIELGVENFWDTTSFALIGLLH